jgi:hypothetical protein
MKRLIEKGLMFGNLVPVDTPALVERYNRALERLTGRRTDIADFHIDISGFSPEVGDALGDMAYLNPSGANRQFILLTTAQKTAPLLNAEFSTFRAILRRFIEEHEAELFALTARDVVIGELDGSVLDLSSPARLFDIRRVTVRADTLGGHVAEAEKLARLIERFRSERDAWWDEALIAEMIALARVTGDVTRTPIALREASFPQDDFWTARFGGVYLFRSVKAPALIAAQPKERLGRLPVETVLDFSDRNGIARFLDANGLVEPIVRARGIDAAAILRQKMDFILVDAAAGAGADVGRASRRDLRQIVQRLGLKPPPAWEGLAALLRWVEDGGPWPRISSEHPAYFYSLRARPGERAELVNMLLAELSPLDVRQLFICHKPAFYRAYAGWPEAKREWVAEFLAREYAVDKAGARAALFGGEPAMAEEPARPPAQPARGRDRGRPADPGADLIARVGPWGAVRGRGR